jgi:hypothetical protein
VRRKPIALLPVTVIAAAALTGACMDAEVEVQQWDEIQALQNSVSELRTYAGELELLIDSLNRVMLRQDTALRLIVDFTGAQVPAYRPPGG